VISADDAGSVKLGCVAENRAHDRRHTTVLLIASASRIRGLNRRILIGLSLTQ
jgi:hypothetical protein